jgi:hypothetical protein
VTLFLDVIGRLCHLEVIVFVCFDILSVAAQLLLDIFFAGEVHQPPSINKKHTATSRAQHHWVGGAEERKSEREANREKVCLCGRKRERERREERERER